MATKTRKTYTPASADEKKAAVEAAHAKIAEQVAAITTSEDWKSWLRQAARFHTYSFGNMLLMTAQAEQRGMDEITRVAGFHAWKDLGRSVKKGETGLRILRPISVVIKPGEKGYVEGLKKSRLVGFGLTSVFDLQQTEGEPLAARPTFTYPEGEVPEGFLDRLHALADTWGFPIRTGVTANGGQADGHTDPVRKEIVMSPRLVGKDARYAGTAIHELAHSQLHMEEGYDYAEHRGTAETEAESVAFVVGEYFGLDMGTESFHYVAGWGKDPAVVLKAGQRIMTTARKIIDALEG